MRDHKSTELNRFQRVGSISNTHAGRDFENAVQQFFAREGIPLEACFPVPVGHRTPKLHRFDLGSREPPVVVECKSYTWTSGGNSPSAKLRSLNEAMLIFSVTPPAYRKMLVMLRHLRGGTSLAEHYIHSQGHLIPAGVEMWEYDEAAGSGERLL